MSAPTLLRLLALCALLGAPACTKDTPPAPPPPPTEAHNRGAPPVPSHLGTIGARLTVQDGKVYVKNVTPGLPGDKAGLKEGMIVTELNGKPAAGMTKEQVTENARGAAGTALVLSVVGPAGGEPKQIIITREKVAPAPGEDPPPPGTPPAPEPKGEAPAPAPGTAPAADPGTAPAPAPAPAEKPAEKPATP